MSILVSLCLLKIEIVGEMNSEIGKDGNSLGFEKFHNFSLLCFCCYFLYLRIAQFVLLIVCRRRII